MKTQTILKSRRHFLRGAGVALALPWLESLPLLAQDGAAAADPNKPPLRFALHLLFERRRSRRTGGPRAAARPWSSAPPPQPLTPIREDIVFIHGLYNQPGFRQSTARTWAAWPTCSRARGQPRPRRHPRRHHHGPGARASRSATRPRCPAWRSASSPTSCGWKTASR